MTRAVIIDDERRSRESLKYLIEKYTNEVYILGEGDDVDTGIKCIQLYKPDVVFLDIRMKTGTGFDVLNAFPNADFHVIFTTAYNEYAIKAFKFNAVDYLLKPIETEALVAAMQKLQQFLSTDKRSNYYSAVIEHINQFNTSDPKITISTNEGYEFIRVADISRMEADGAYTKIFLVNGTKFLTSRLLKEYESLLLDYAFYRVHHSHLINTKDMAKYLKTDGGLIIMSNGDEIPVARRKREPFVKQFVKKII
jgi:two-component system LytT family response regulator